MPALPSFCIIPSVRSAFPFLAEEALCPLCGLKPVFSRCYHMAFSKLFWCAQCHRTFWLTPTCKKNRMVGMPAESYWIYAMLTGGKKTRNWNPILWGHVHVHIQIISWQKWNFDDHEIFFSDKNKTLIREISGISRIKTSWSIHLEILQILVYMKFLNKLQLMLDQWEYAPTVIPHPPYPWWALFVLSVHSWLLFHLQSGKPNRWHLYGRPPQASPRPPPLVTPSAVFNSVYHEAPPSTDL